MLRPEQLQPLALGLLSGQLLAVPEQVLVAARPLVLRALDEAEASHLERLALGEPVARALGAPGLLPQEPLPLFMQQAWPLQVWLRNQDLLRGCRPLEE